MNRKDLAKALTGLDDQWIEEARESSPWVNRLKFWPLAAAAAVALVLLWTNWTQPAVIVSYRDQVITAAGINLGDLSLVPSPATPHPRSINGLTLALRLDMDSPYQIEAESGVFTARDPAGSILLEDGSSLEAAGVIDLLWTIDPPKAGAHRLVIHSDGNSFKIDLAQNPDGTWQLSQRPR